MPRLKSLALGLMTLAALAASPGPTRAAEPHAGRPPRPAATPRQAATPRDAATPREAAGSHGGESAHGEAGHGAGGGSPNILEIKPSLALSTLIVFGLLLLVLWRFAWGPLAQALDDRERAQADAVRRADEARAEAERLLAEHRAQMAQAADQARQILDEARRAAENTANGIIQKAQAEAEASRDRARRDIESARDQALGEIWNRGAELAVNVAGKVLARELNHDDHRRLIEAATRELPASANGHGRALA